MRSGLLPVLGPAKMKSTLGWKIEATHTYYLTFQYGSVRLSLLLLKVQISMCLQKDLHTSVFEEEFLITFTALLEVGGSLSEGKCTTWYRKWDTHTHKEEEEGGKGSKAARLKAACCWWWRGKGGKGAQTGSLLFMLLHFSVVHNLYVVYIYHHFYWCVGQHGLSSFIL